MHDKIFDDFIVEPVQIQRFPVVTFPFGRTESNND